MIGNAVPQVERLVRPHLGVDDPGGDVGRWHLHQVAPVELLRHHIVCIDRVFGLGAFLGLDHRDPAAARLGRVDAVEDELILALVVDVDAGVAMRHLETAVAGAQDLAGNGDVAAAGHDLVHHDGLLDDVEITADRHAVGAERDARQRLAAVVQERLGAIRREVRSHLERDGLHPALDQAVDVQVARRDVDTALRQDLVTVGGDRAVEVQIDRQAEHRRLHVGRVAKLDRRRAAAVGQRVGAQQAVVDVLPRIAVGVQPVVGVEREVGLRLQVDRRRADVARDVDAAVEVLDRDRSGLVDDVTDDVETAVHVRHVENAVIPGERIERFLRDLDGLAGLVVHRRELGVVEVHVAGRLHRVLAVDHRHAAVVADDGVGQGHREWRPVVDLDLGAAARLDLGADAPRRGVRAVGLDEHRARRRVDRRQVDEQRVQALIHDRRGHVRGRVGGGLEQAEIPEGLVERIQLHLVPRHRFGIAGMAGDPAQDLLALLEQQAAQVAIGDGRLRHAHRLHDVQLVDEFRAQVQRRVAAIEGGRIALDLRDCRSARNVVGDVGFTGHRREPFPARGVGVVLVLEQDVLPRSLHLELVKVADIAPAVGATDHLDDRAGGDGEPDLARVHGTVFVCRIDRQTQVDLLGRGEQGADARGVEWRARETVRHGTDQHHGAALEAGLDLRVRTDQYLVDAVDVADIRHVDAVGNERQRQHVAVGLGAQVAADALDREQVDVAERPHLGAAGEVDRVVLVDVGLDHRHIDAEQRIGVDLRVRVAQQDVRHAGIVATGIDVNVGALQGRVRDVDRVVGGLVGACDSAGTADGREDQQVRRSGGVRRRSRGEEQVAGIVFECGAGDVDVRVALRDDLGFALGDRESRGTLDGDTVLRADVGLGSDAERARRRIGADCAQSRPGQDVDLGLERIARLADLGVAFQGGDIAQAGRTGLEIVAAGELGLLQLVRRPDGDVARGDRGVRANLDVSLAAEGHVDAGAGSHREREGIAVGLRIHILAVARGQGKARHVDDRAGAEPRARRVVAGDVGLRAGDADHATAGSRALGDQVVAARRRDVQRAAGHGGAVADVGIDFVDASAASERDIGHHRTDREHPQCATLRSRTRRVVRRGDDRDVAGGSEHGVARLSHHAGGDVDRGSVAGNPHRRCRHADRYRLAGLGGGLRADIGIARRHQGLVLRIRALDRGPQAALEMVLDDRDTQRSAEAEADRDIARIAGHVGILVRMHEHVLVRRYDQRTGDLRFDVVSHRVGDLDAASAQPDQAAGDRGRDGVNLVDLGTLRVGQDRHVAGGVDPTGGVASRVGVDLVGHRVLHDGCGDRRGPQADGDRGPDRIGTRDMAVGDRRDDHIAPCVGAAPLDRGIDAGRHAVGDFGATASGGTADADGHRHRTRKRDRVHGVGGRGRHADIPPGDDRRILDSRDDLVAQAGAVVEGVIADEVSRQRDAHGARSRDVAARDRRGNRPDRGADARPAVGVHAHVACRRGGHGAAVDSGRDTVVHDVEGIGARTRERHGKPDPIRGRERCRHGGGSDSRGLVRRDRDRTRAGGDVRVANRGEHGVAHHVRGFRDTDGDRRRCQAERPRDRSGPRPGRDRGIVDRLHVDTAGLDVGGTVVVDRALDIGGDLVERGHARAARAEPDCPHRKRSRAGTDAGIDGLGRGGLHREDAVCIDTGVVEVRLHVERIRIGVGGKNAVHAPLPVAHQVARHRRADGHACAADATAARDRDGSHGGRERRDIDRVDVDIAGGGDARVLGKRQDTAVHLVGGRRACAADADAAEGADADRERRRSGGRRDVRLLLRLQGQVAARRRHAQHVAIGGGGVQHIGGDIVVDLVARERDPDRQRDRRRAIESRRDRSGARAGGDGGSILGTDGDAAGTHLARAAAFDEGLDLGRDLVLDRGARPAQGGRPGAPSRDGHGDRRDRRIDGGRARGRDTQVARGCHRGVADEGLDLSRRARQVQAGAIDVPADVVAGDRGADRRADAGARAHADRGGDAHDRGLDVGGVRGLQNDVSARIERAVVPIGQCLPEDDIGGLRAGARQRDAGPGAVARRDRGGDGHGFDGRIVAGNQFEIAGGGMDLGALDECLHVVVDVVARERHADGERHARRAATDRRGERRRAGIRMDPRRVCCLDDDARRVNGRHLVQRHHRRYAVVDVGLDVSADAVFGADAGPGEADRIADTT